MDVVILRVKPAVVSAGIIWYLSGTADNGRMASDTICPCLQSIDMLLFRARLHLIAYLRVDGSTMATDTLLEPPQCHSVVQEIMHSRYRVYTEYRLYDLVLCSSCIK